jgi:CRISPR/Cas system CSM-associated protein Csm2 small subunit
MDNQNKICSVDDCNREVFTELSQNKCVLHCEKPRDKNRYHLLGSGFYAELEKYIRKISKTAALVFKFILR